MKKINYMRTSIQFKKGDKKSVILYTTHDVPSTALTVHLYLRGLTLDSMIKWNRKLPLFKLEPQVVMADFIRF